MSPEKQRIAIAEACGWTPTPNGHYTMNPAGLNGQFVHPLNLPNYLNDLNAMREAEKVLLPSQWVSYWSFLEPLACSPGNMPIIFADAAQRAEAFLRTLNKWEGADQ